MNNLSVDSRLNEISRLLNENKILHSLSLYRILVDELKSSLEEITIRSRDNEYMYTMPGDFPEMDEEFNKAFSLLGWKSLEEMYKCRL